MLLDEETSTRLSEIFTPHSAKRLKDAIQNNRKLVHYTSAENALKIIKNREIWLRNARAMDDFTEVEYGYHQLNEYFRDEKNLNRFLRSLDSIKPDLIKEGVDLFNQLSIDIKNSSYISCFSEHIAAEDNHGRLSMWRAFASSKDGVALIFKFPKPGTANPLNTFFSPVAYFSTEQLEAELDQVIKNIDSNIEFLKSLPINILIGSVYMMLMSAVVSIKHTGFHEEREWRLVHSPKQNPSSLVTPNTETIRGIPQIVYKLKLENSEANKVNNIELVDLLDAIIIGPTQYPISIIDALVFELEQAGVKDASAKVRFSGIPIRT